MREEILAEFEKYVNENKIADYSRFFKTGLGEYGEGDKFLGVKVPDTRKVVKKYFASMSFEEIEEFLNSPYHEHRLFALLVLVYKYKSKKLTSEAQRERIYDFYVSHANRINNWDLVDVTAPHIVGAHLLQRDKTLLYNFANSNDLWKKRIAIVSTFAFINSHQFQDTFDIADILLQDKHDLIHKAVGWAIRNVGNKNEKAMLEYLTPRYKKMPRAMLRYAIEKLDEELRLQYLRGEIEWSIDT